MVLLFCRVVPAACRRMPLQVIPPALCPARFSTAFSSGEQPAAPAATDEAGSSSRGSRPRWRQRGGARRRSLGHAPMHDGAANKILPQSRPTATQIPDQRGAKPHPLCVGGRAALPPPPAAAGGAAAKPDGSASGVRGGAENPDG